MGSNPTGSIGKPQMPCTSAAAFLAAVVDDGGSGGRTLDVRRSEDGGWDVVLLLDGGYSDRDDAVASMKLDADYLRRAYVAEVEVGRIEAASDEDLARIGLRADQGDRPLAWRSRSAVSGNGFCAAAPVRPRWL